MSPAGRSDGRLAVAHFMPWSGMGGVEIATLRMVDAIREQFDQVAFCLPDAKVREFFAAADVPTIDYLPPMLSARSATKYYHDSLVIARQLRALDIDIVHFAETKAAEHNSLAAALAGCRMVCHVRNTYPQLTLRQRLPLLPVDCFIFVSKEARREFGVSLDEPRARVIYDAIELPSQEAMASRTVVRRELGIPEECIVIGMVARVNPQKDFFTLAAAAAKVVSTQPNTRFLVVGDNALVDMNRQHFKAVTLELDRLGIRDRFIFTGHRSDVYRLIAAMDISVLATHREGFGLCLAESMVMQKPVVATAVGGILDFVENNVTGLLHTHGDADGLADAMLSLINDPGAAERLGMAGYEYVEGNYSRQGFVREISATYRDVARARTFRDIPAAAGA